MTCNPDHRPEMPFGETLRTPDGKIAGMILAVPRLYLLGDKTLLGLAAGDFFIDAAARMQGFFMLRRYFKLSHGDFWFANSCNRQSGPLWAKCGCSWCPSRMSSTSIPSSWVPCARAGHSQAVAEGRQEAAWCPRAGRRLDCLATDSGQSLSG